ncbi:MAG: DNA-processing protein DprA [Candidatus Caldatribacteriaceae bacterium]
MTTKELPFFVAFSHIGGIGPVRFRRLLEVFGGAFAAWNAPLLDLQEVLGEGLARQIVSFRESTDPEKLCNDVLREGIRVITWEDEEYPPLLRTVSHPPFLLYVEGDFSFLEHERYVAVVGTRRPTPYGKRAARFFARDLAQRGWIVVSGLALGIDGEAQRSVVEEGYPTVAVLGSGLRRVYPRVHLSLSREILEKGGAIVSEYPPFAEPRPEYFPLRNRIIAGLSLGVVVIEAPRKSGALITANLALEEGREVMAVPGPIFSPQSEGTNALIAQGAKPVQSATDVLETFGILKDEVQPKEEEPPLSGEEEALLSLIDYIGVFKEELLEKTGWGEGEFFRVLLALEMKGLVEEIPGGKVARR